MSADLRHILQQKILADIPLTQYMGLTVSYYDGQELQIGADLNKNINHRQTAFGGSITSMATLAAWGWLYLKLYEIDISARIVIQQGVTDYLQPIDADFIAVCKDIEETKLDKFINTLKRRKMARIDLNVQVLCKAELGATFSGVFVTKV